MLDWRIDDAERFWRNNLKKLLCEFAIEQVHERVRVAFEEDAFNLHDTTYRKRGSTKPQPHGKLSNNHEKEVH